MIISLTFYTFAISGGMYNIIKNTDFNGKNEDGSIKYVADGSRNQYGIESYLAGGLQIAIGIFAIAMCSLATKPIHKEKQKWYHKLGFLSSSTPLAAVIFFFMDTIISIIY